MNTDGLDTKILNFDRGLLKFPTSVKVQYGRLTSMNVNSSCSTILNPTPSQGQEPFACVKVLIGSIRCEIWSLFNTEMRVSEIEEERGLKREREN
jgi:hypothetical protein